MLAETLRLPISTPESAGFCGFITRFYRTFQNPLSIFEDPAIDFCGGFDVSFSESKNKGFARLAMDGNLFQALVITGAGLLGSLITLLFTQYSKRKEELFERKRAMYDKILKPYMAMFHEILAHKHNIPPTIKGEVGQIQEISFLLPLTVPDKVFKAFQRVQKCAHEIEEKPQEKPEKAFATFYLAIGDLLLEIRKDLGYKRTSITNVI